MRHHFSESEHLIMLSIYIYIYIYIVLFLFFVWLFFAYHMSKKITLHTYPAMCMLATCERRCLQTRIMSYDHALAFLVAGPTGS
jgi:hypothetical protein